MRLRFITNFALVVSLNMSLSLPSGATTGGFPGLSNTLPSSFPSSQFNCSVEQPASQGVADFQRGTTGLLGFTLNLDVPFGWGCAIEEAYGSGGGISFSPGESGYYFVTGKISLLKSANANDSGVNFCQLSRVISQPLQKCSPVQRSIPSAFRIKYLYGSPNSRGLIAIIESPYSMAYGGARQPTLTLIAGGVHGPSIVFSCQIGHSYSQMCYSDELGLARLLKHSNYPYYWNS